MSWGSPWSDWRLIQKRENEERELRMFEELQAERRRAIEAKAAQEAQERAQATIPAAKPRIKAKTPPQSR